MIIQLAAVPYTSEFQALGTACATSLLTSNYFQQTGVAKGRVANGMYLTLENTNLRYKINGSAPATSCGHILLSGQSLYFQDVAIIKNFQCLNEAAAATAYFHITYFVG